MDSQPLDQADRTRARLPTEKEANDDTPRHDLAKVVNELANVEDAGEMEDSGCDEGCVPASESIAVVW
jgi:hypothetical protein